MICMPLQMITSLRLNSINQIKADNELTTNVVWETESNMFGELLLTLLPFVVIIGIWIFIMRRMSTGAGGGAAVHG